MSTGLAKTTPQGFLKYHAHKPHHIIHQVQRNFNANTCVPVKNALYVYIYNYQLSAMQYCVMELIDLDDRCDKADKDSTTYSLSDLVGT